MQKFSINPLNPFLKGGFRHFDVTKLTYGNGMCMFTCTIIMVSKIFLKFAILFKKTIKRDNW